MKFSWGVILLLIQISAFCQASVDSILAELDEVIKNKEYFVAQKQSRVDAIKDTLFSQEKKYDDSEVFRYTLKLCEEYQTLKFDSAFHYSEKLLEVACRSKDPDKIARAKTELANILISAGIFTESQDTLRSIRLDQVSNQTKANYYNVLSRGYFDMESFSQSHKYSAIYREKGMACIDSALSCYPDGSWQYLSLSAQKNIKQGENTSAIETLNRLINSTRLNNDQLALQLMSLAFVYSILGEHDNALKYMAEAAIADFRSAKKEAVALLFLANYLFERGDIIRASKYINVALEDSRFYGSNFRLWQISQYLPVIKTEHIVTIEKQKQKLWYSVIIVSLLSVIVLISLVIIFKQMHKLRKVKNEIEATNKKLAYTNEELLVANRIKEEYVGYFFSVNTQMIEKLDKFKNSIARKLKRKQFDELTFELDSINIQKEKTSLYNNFDEVFLKIFPDFVRKFNDLLKEGEQIHLKEGHLLNTELRIFALIRLGIHDSEKIAKILDYSVNTIYTYKTKIKNKAKVPNEEFENEVMKIKRF